MMVGNNELRLNKATMMKAVQQWLDSVCSPPIFVYDITYTSNELTFTVKVSDTNDKDNHPNPS